MCFISAEDEYKDRCGNFTFPLCSSVFTTTRFENKCRTKEWGKNRENKESSGDGGLGSSCLT